MEKHPAISGCMFNTSTNMELYIVHKQYQYDLDPVILSYHKTMEGAVNKIASEKEKQGARSDVDLFITIDVVED